MTVILHITSQQQWDAAKAKGVYECESLDTEGFIHCSSPSQVVSVANFLFKGQQGLVLLCVDVDRLHPELRYEPVADQHFPHIYGPLNLNAVIQVIEFSLNDDGKFEPPAVLNKLH